MCLLSLLSRINVSVIYGSKETFKHKYYDFQLNISQKMQVLNINFRVALAPFLAKGTEN